LKIGKMDASDEEITEAAAAANVHSFISKLPNEYLTEVLHHFLWKLIKYLGSSTIVFNQTWIRVLTHDLLNSNKISQGPKSTE